MLGRSATTQHRIACIRSDHPSQSVKQPVHVVITKYSELTASAGQITRLPDVHPWVLHRPQAD